MMIRSEANYAASICKLADSYYHGSGGLQLDEERANAIELFTKSVELGNTTAHYKLAVVYKQMGDLKKAKFHFEAAAMAGHEGERYNLGLID
jgi:TPR repeat protein